jgi:hypothetical protein
MGPSNRLLRAVKRIWFHGFGDEPPALGGFVDGLVQSFENCRQGLSDEAVAKGSTEAERFFLDLYEREIPRLREALGIHAPYLSRGNSEKLFGEIDTLMRRVVIPGYVREASPHTRRERRGFYLVAPQYRIFERIGWTAAGLALGGFIVAAPFIPLWSKEWMLLFMIAGFFFPSVRTLLTVRAYELGLNRLVDRADREIARLDAAYLSTVGERDAPGAEDASSARRAAVAPHATAADDAGRPGHREDRAKGGA